MQDKAQQAAGVASKTLKQTYTTVGSGVKGAAKGVDERFDVSGKAQQAVEGLKQQADSADKRWQIRNRARRAYKDAERQFPRWKKQYDKFSNTLPGKVAWTAFLVWGFYSGVFFRLLNLVFLLWWLAPIFLLPLAQRANKQAQAEFARQRAAQQARQRNPFAGFGGNPFASNMGQSAGFRGSQSASQGQRSSGSAEQDGPVIDAEWTTIDEGDH